MFILQVVILASVLSYGCAQIHLRQAQLSVTRAIDKTARIDCEASGIQNFGSAFIHWYRHRPGEAPEWILYFKTQADKSSFDEKKFRVEKTTEKSTCTLRVDKLTYNDMATYYCAYWDRTITTAYCKTKSQRDSSSWIKYFGTGTKLVVSDTPAKLDSTKIQVLPLSTEQDGKVSYMCLIQDFYPNVIKVTWKDEEKKNAENNAVHEEIWPPGDDNTSYSISSWLTIDKNSNKNYNCNYQHEFNANSISIKSPDKHVVSQTIGSCINKPENGTTLSTDITEHFMHRTAYLIYIVLLLKSTMYYVIVLFFIYRMQSPIKHRGNMSWADFVVTCNTVGAVKIFGTGTKLVVTNIQAKLDSTKIQVLPLSTEQDGKVSYMCLIEDFYPNVIKVTWEDEKKNAEKNAVHEEIWPPGDNQQSYSMSSWLTVDKNSNKNYHCNYQHEKDTGSVPIKSPDTFSDTTVMPQTTRGCIKNAENGTMLSTDITDSFIHRTAYFIYIVLLLKSTMYYVIVLFFIYRMQSPIKRQGKKP
ncbi:uncharacterized protein LOC128831306 [Malaclemys terrapin pileata]|uniref:uncharacterized protein LOC128831306 n=1 Tax=Malaclemys terrapin pileata TaxID=2991368 RepID=UPI0023A8913E|nr:uncharacterized protein LOC128831306 [Malaclemys terrapin pileata]